MAPVGSEEDDELHARIMGHMADEIVALQEAVRWLDRCRGELPSGMPPGAYAAYVRAMEEER